MLNDQGLCIAQGGENCCFYKVGVVLSVFGVIFFFLTVLNNLGFMWF